MTPTKLINARKRLGVTQVCMADSLGLSTRHYRRMETGVYPIPESIQMATLFLIMVADDVPSRELAHLIEDSL